MCLSIHTKAFCAPKCINLVLKNISRFTFSRSRIDLKKKKFAQISDTFIFIQIAETNYGIFMSTKSICWQVICGHISEY